MPPLTPDAPAPARAPAAVRGLFLVALVFAVREAQPLLAPVVIAVVLTFVLAPAVRALRRRGLPEVTGAALVVLALLGSTVPLAASLAGPAAQWWDSAPATVAQLLAHFDRLRAAVPGLRPPPPAVPRAAPPGVRPGAGAGPAPGTGRVTPASPPPPTAEHDPSQAAHREAPDPVKDRLASEGVVLTGRLLGQSVSLALSATATVILLYFLLASEHWMLSRMVEAVPRRRTRALLLGGVRAAQREIGRYLVALGLINLAAGIATGLALWGIGLPNPTLWGAVTAVLCFIPYIGPMLIMALLLLAGVTTFSQGLVMLAPLGAFLAIHALETNILSPWIVGRRLALSPVSVFLSVMFWGWLWGITGALIAVPLLIALRSACVRSRRLRLLGRFLEGDRRELPTLHALLRGRPRGPGAARSAQPGPPAQKR